MVPFPRLPPGEGESRPAKSPPASLTTLLLLLLSLANATALAYVAARRTWQSMIRIKGESELYALLNELAASQNEVDVLRSRMEVLEMSRGAGGETPADDEGEFAGLFGPTRVAGDDDEDRSKVDGRKAWFEKMRLLEEDKHSALGRFQKSLSEF